jgi:methionine-rich copper-binding protein CopC
VPPTLHGGRPAVRGRARALLVLLLAALALLVASPAGAHDRLVGSTPADGATLVAVPTTVDLTYSDDILPTGVVVEVRDPAGANRAVGTPTVAGRRVSVAVDPAAPGGAYTVAWRVVSSDGHPIEGGFGFALALPAPAPTATPSLAPAAAATLSTPRARAGLAADLPPLVVVLVAVGSIGAVLTAVVLGLRRRP